MNKDNDLFSKEGREAFMLKWASAKGEEFILLGEDGLNTLNEYFSEDIGFELKDEHSP